MRLPLLFAPLLLMACAQPEVSKPDDLSAGEPCDPAIFADYIGREATQELGAEMQQLAAAQIVRWINPDTMVTMDYRPNRLNIYLDAEGRIERASCG